MNKAALPVFTGCFFIFIFFLIIGPRLPDSQQRSYCVHNIYFSKHFGFSLNCDSIDFIKIAYNPKIILEKNNVRQDRPGSIFFISAIRFALSMLHSEKNGYVKLKIGKEIYIVNADYVYIYFYYIILNVLTLLASFYIFTNILTLYEKNSYSWHLFFIGLLFIYNDVVKAFIISPHNQIFNIFVPMFCIWCFVSVVEDNFFDRHTILLTSVLVGFGVTAYASLFLFLPSIIIPAIAIKRPYRMAVAAHFFLRSVIIIILVTLPSLLWYIYVLDKTGSFYSHSTEAYNHVVWMKNAFQDGLFVLLSKLFNNIIQIVILAAKQGWILLLVLLPFIIGRYDKKIKWKTMLQSPIVTGSIFVSIMFIVFFSMVGLVVPRISYSAIPPMIVLTSYVIQHIEQKSSSLAYILTPVIIFAYGIYETVKDGPYS